ncbi:MAG: DUF1385 domain-containing protein [Clostridium sp.]|nr:DUF1385 domain-containing protein [Acetatifactor muris]MCM1526799.1 DUF1385 domain-containing protein [Bacteroides sp.]MCM1563000.1 DUF1385 domain-containing protein [Clostridium sp.]
MAKKKVSRYSGIGGQAVLEGIMMKNKERYAIAVRKPNGEIEVEVEHYRGPGEDGVWKKIPFVRGVFNFVDSMILGTKALNYSASFYDEEEPEHKESGSKAKEAGEKLAGVLLTLFSVVLAVGIFVVLPYFLSSLFEKYVRNASLIAIIEGCIRIVIFLLYAWGISAMKDIRRLYCYHGAEHKCINCIEKGHPLTVRNVMKSSRLHRRCGTSFIFFVLIVSIILFFFIRVDNVAQRVALRILLMPVVAGISYELIRLAGRHDNVFVKILSAPGMLIQRMTTKEPDRGMAEVAIAAVEAVFDWRAYLEENFGYSEEDWEEDIRAEERADAEDMRTEEPDDMRADAAEEP